MDTTTWCGSGGHGIRRPWVQKRPCGLPAIATTTSGAWRLNANKVGVDSTQAGFSVGAKWTGKNDAAWRSSPYNPRSDIYDEQGILDQARRLLELNKAMGGNGVRYAVSTEAARVHFEALFNQHFPEANIQVWHVPGTGMK